MRSCRGLLKRHQTLENEVSLWEQKINDLVYAGEEMAQDGHFDAESILRQGQAYRRRLADFKGPPSASLDGKLTLQSDGHEQVVQQLRADLHSLDGNAAVDG